VALTWGLSGVSGVSGRRVDPEGVLPIIVPSIIKKRRGGSTYLYAATSARVGGRPRIVEQVYLGTEEEVIARLTGGRVVTRACPRPSTAGSVTSRRCGGCWRGWTRSR
jgi:hypothetical protein